MISSKPTQKQLTYHNDLLINTVSLNIRRKAASKFWPEFFQIHSGMCVLIEQSLGVFSMTNTIGVLFKEILAFDGFANMWAFHPRIPILAVMDSKITSEVLLHVSDDIYNNLRRSIQLVSLIREQTLRDFLDSLDVY